MKNTLLALMLVSSLFVISCGADATKPGDAYKSQPTETVTGTKTAPSAVSGTVDVSTFASFGEKVTEIVQITSAGTTNTVSEIKKNKDGGIYQFNTDATSGAVTYKYSKKVIAPISTVTNSNLTITPGDMGQNGTVTISTPNYAVGIEIVSITYNGESIYDYQFEPTTKTITLNGITTGTVTVIHQYANMNKIGMKPTKEAVIEADAAGSGNHTIQLTAADDAGKSYICIVTDNNNTPTYLSGIIPSTGTITLTTMKNTKINYQLWVY
ncbi:hypothetical protein [Brachyspira pilosicoli]|uniref:hypothetical protein n=1 Tax=Brachyspira pilosicoli TaxID=52584 RepID=UPI0030040CF7